MAPARWGYSVVAAAALLASGCSAASNSTTSSTPVQLTLTQLGGTGLSFTTQLFPKVNAASGAVVDFDARVSYEFRGDAVSVSLVNRRAYAVVGNGDAAACLSGAQVPSIESLVAAFLHPTVLAASSSSFQCDSGKQLVAFAFSGESYAFCATSESVPTTNGDLQTTLALLQANSEATPSLEAAEAKLAEKAACPVVYDASALTATPVKRQLEAQADCTCKEGTKACLFVHGLGLSADGPALDEYTKAWGSIKTQAQCCSSMKFMQMDTVNNAWYGDYLAQKVCDTAVGMAASAADKMALEGIALVGHSMGNLVIANAALKGFCALGASSKWISLAGPLLGSQSANFALGACSGNSAVVATLQALGICPIGASIASLPYIHSNRSNASIDALYEQAGAVYRSKVSSNLCGVSATGLVSAKSARYALLGAVSGHATSENDGAVHILSCQAGLDASKYSTSWSGGNFYKADINHGDASFTEGDGLFGDSRKPVKWFNCQF